MISQYEWMLAPILLGVLGLICNLILGRQVLLRGVIFIDLAMAQIAALGVVMMDLWFHDYVHQYRWVGLLGAWGLTLLAACFIRQAEKQKVAQLEAIIGVCYVIAACLAVIAVSHNPHGADMVKGLLNGRLLWSDWQDLWPIAGLTLALAGVARYRAHWLSGGAFYFIFALAIPPLVLNLGVYLEFTALIVPALLTLTMPLKRAYRVGLLLGLSGVLFGLLGSLIYDWPAGPAIVLVMVISATGMAIFFQHLSPSTFRQVSQTSQEH